MSEYLFGLGKDRRELGRSSSAEFMRNVVTPQQKPRYGEKNGNCKLSASDITAIKADREHTGPFLAKQYHVTKAHIYRIQKYRSRRKG